MHAKDDEDGPEGGDEEAGKHGHDVEGGHEASGDPAGDGVDDGTHNHEGDERGEHKHEHVTQQVTQDARQQLHRLLEPRLQVHGKDDGEDGLQVARVGQHHRRTKEGRATRLGKRVLETNHRGAHQEGCHTHGDPLVALELLGRSGRDEDGQELEDAVTDGVEHHVSGACLVHPAQRNGHHDQGAGKTGCGEDANERDEDARDDVKESVEAEAALLLFFGLHLAGSEVGQLCDHRVVGLPHLVANDHLVLAGGVHHLDDAVQLADALVVGLALVLEHEAQAGDAVRDGGDVVGASHELDHVGSELVPILCHCFPFPSFVFRVYPVFFCAQWSITARAVPIAGGSCGDGAGSARRG